MITELFSRYEALIDEFHEAASASASHELYKALLEAEAALMKCFVDGTPKVREIRMSFEWRDGETITHWQWLGPGEIAPTPAGARRGWLLRFR
jgi:hypothetical protein